MTSGGVYPLGAIYQVSLSKVAAVLGTEFSEAVRSDDGFSIDAVKFAEIAPTLPRDDAALLERVLNEAMAEPVEAGIEAAKQANFDPDLVSKEKFTDFLVQKGHKVSDGDFRLTVKMGEK